MPNPYPAMDRATVERTIELIRLIDGHVTHLRPLFVVREHLDSLSPADLQRIHDHVTHLHSASVNTHIILEAIFDTVPE